MPDVSKIITITEIGADSGPDYSVWYSNDCIEYTMLSGSVSLPTVGSMVGITIPDTTNCVKLVNINSRCRNEVVKTTPGVTTTTTTVAPTTTTSTTTAAPIYYVMDKCDGTGEYTYPLKDDSNLFSIGSIVKIEGEGGKCATLTSVYVGTPFIFFTSVDGIDYANCDVCEGITTTTTSTTTTTTTTIPLVWYNASDCGVGKPNRNSNPVPLGTFNVGDRVEMPIGIFGVIVGFSYTNPGGTLYTFSATGQTGCPTTTTTTTTSTTTTSTTTTAAPTTTTTTYMPISGSVIVELTLNSPEFSVQQVAAGWTPNGGTTDIFPVTQSYSPGITGSYFLTGSAALTDVQPLVQIYATGSNCISQSIQWSTSVYSSSVLLYNNVSDFRFDQLSPPLCLPREYYIGINFPVVDKIEYIINVYTGSIGPL